MSDYSRKIECLQQAVQSAPEYRDIVPLFIELYRYLEQSGGSYGVSVAAAAGDRSERTRAGFPLVAPGDLRVDIAVCSRFLAGAVRMLGRAGRGGTDELDRLEAAVLAGELDLAGLFAAVLERRRSVLDEAAAAIGVPSPLLEYVIEIPLKAALEGFARGVDPLAVADWKEAVCPVCGSRPGMAELTGDEGRRQLCCSACTFQWQFKRIQCPYCSNEDTGKLSYFTAGEGATRIDVCSACSRYIKTRDSRKPHGDVPLDVEDLLSMHLDLLAAREGYERGK